MGATPIPGAPFWGLGRSPPETTAMGALYHHVCGPRPAGMRFDPMNINFGLLPPLPDRAKKQDRRRLQCERATRDFSAWLAA